MQNLGVGPPLSNLSELRRQAALFERAARRADDDDAVRIARNLIASLRAWAEDLERLAAALAEAAQEEPADEDAAPDLDRADDADRWTPPLRRSA